MEAAPTPEAPGSDMRDTTKALIGHYVDHTRPDRPGAGDRRTPPRRLRHRALPRAAVHATHDLEPRGRRTSRTRSSPTSPTAARRCRRTSPSTSWSPPTCSSTSTGPWLAAAEIARILKPGGLAITHTLFSWRNHPCPIDYWRFSTGVPGVPLRRPRVPGERLRPEPAADRPTGLLAVGRGLGAGRPARRLAGALERLPRRPEGNRRRRCRGSRTATTRWPATCGWTPRAR